jgi:hypothetical protein
MSRLTVPIKSVVPSDLVVDPECSSPAEKNPLVKLLMDVSESQESILEDYLLLCNIINLHRCSDYCLRAPKNSPSSSLKQCRMEFGTSLNPVCYSQAIVLRILAPVRLKFWKV